MYNNISVNSRTLPPTSGVNFLFRSAILIVFALLVGSSLNANKAICAAQSRSDHWGLGTDQPVPGDYDGDARTDLAVFRPSDGCWYIFNSSNGTFKRVQFGESSDQPVAADYDGDGKDDIAVFRPSTRVWYYLKSSDGSFQSQQFGASGDIAVPGDFDGNGLSNFAVWRPSTGYWYTSLNAATNYGAVRLGQVGDVPVAADYDGDGKTDVTVFRPSTGTFYIWQSSINSLRTRQWGISTDRPLAGDFDRDGKADIGVFRPVIGTWYVLKSIDSTLFTQPWGQSSDRLITHDYDGNGQADMAVFSPGGAIWNILLNPVPLTVPDTTPPVISGVSSSGVTSSAASVSWTTDEASDTQVEYGTSTSYGSSSALNTSMVTSHSAALSGLSANTLYHYRVKSRDAAGNLATSGDFTFTTPAPPDTTPPVISAVLSSAITSNGATVSWTTNEASNTQVDFGTTTSYGSSTTLNTTLVTSHSASLSGLAASTLYHYRVKSRDAAGNLATSGDFTFTTTVTSTCPGFVIEGLASATVGGCGGTTYTVTNLNDSGAGSLREFAQNRSGPRIIRFGVSGTINLILPITINNPFVTIDGSTAPNQGVAIKGGGIDIRAWEVIIRYLRIRPGLEVSNPGSSNAIHILPPDPGYYPPSARTYNVVIDHCSLTWSTDQNLSIQAQGITVQWCIISELVSDGSGTVLIYYSVPSATFHHNLLSNSRGARHPEVGDGDVDWVNNVIYRNLNGTNFYGTGLHLYFEALSIADPGCVLNSTGSSGCDGPEGFPEGGPVRVNFDRNYFKAGPNERLSINAKEIRLFGRRRFASQSSAYFFGNISPARPNDTLPQSALVYQADGGDGYNFPTTSTRHNFPLTSATSATQAYSDVILQVGPRIPCLDSVDRRIVNDVINGTGRPIADPSEVGGWPNLNQPCGP